MADWGVIYNGPMVRALLAQRKGVTRRLASSPLRLCVPRDRIWVRETCVAAKDPQTGRLGVQYLADDTGKLIPDLFEYEDKWNKLNNYRTKKTGKTGNTVGSIHMPRWASRLTQTVSDLVEQRVQDITPEEAIDEGLERDGDRWRVDSLPNHWNEDPVQVYRALWDSLHTKPGERWEDNPQVIAISFTTVLRNIDG